MKCIFSFFFSLSHHIYSFLVRSLFGLFLISEVFLYGTFPTEKKSFHGDILHNIHPSHLFYIWCFSKMVLDLFVTCLRAFHSVSPTGNLYTFNFYLEVFLHQIINLYCSVLTRVLLNSLLTKKKCGECIKGTVLF